MRSTFLLFCASLSLFACSDDSAAPTDAAIDAAPADTASADASALDPTQYCELTVDAYCPFYMRCGRMAEDDLAACRTTFLEVCNAVYEPRYAHLVEQGLLELSASGVAACAEHLASVPCEHQLLDLEGPCRQMWRGKAASGHACGFELDSLICDDSSICALDLTLCGECKPAAQTGEGCGAETACRPPDACISGKCVAPALPGEDCGAGLPHCIAGAACENDQCVAARYVGVGEDCDSRNRCPHRSRCVGGKCVRMALLDQSCGDRTPCASGFCDAATSRCKELGAPQAPCTDRGQCLSGRCESSRCSELDSPCLLP